MRRTEVLEASTHEPIWSGQNLLVLAAALTAMGTLSVLLGQDANWDLRNYHIYNGYAFLKGRTWWDYAPAQIQTYLNPLLDAATYACMTELAPWAVGFALGAVHGLNFWLIYLVARSVLVGFERRPAIGVSLLCAALGVLGAVGLCELGTVFHDLTTAPFVLGGVLAFVRAAFLSDDGRASLRGVALAGVLFGLGTGLKYTLAVYALAAMVATFLTAPSLRERFVRTAVLGISSALGLATSAGFWMSELWHRFGNPLFPFYNSYFKSPYAEPMGFVDVKAVPRTLGDALAYPFTLASYAGVTTEMPFRDSRITAVYVLAALVAVLAVAGRVLGRGLTVPAAARARSAPWLAVFLGVAYFVWLRQWAIYRYVVPLEALAPLALLLLASKVIGDRKRLAIVAVLGFTTLGFTTKPADYGRVPWGDSFVEVRAPPLPAPSNTTVVMTSQEPLSYVIPSFPRKVRFIRVESNMFDPSRKTRLMEEIARALAAPERDYYLLTVYDAVQHSRPLLAVYSLAIVGRSCKPLRSNLDSLLLFCHLRRTHGGPVEAEPEDAIAFGSTATSAGMSGTLTTPTNPVKVCAKTGVGAATVNWTASGTDTIEIHLDAPSGTLFARGGRDGTAETGPWVREGTTLYLQNIARYVPLTPDNTLARLVFRTVPGGPCP